MFDKTPCLILILLAYILIQNCGQWQGTPLTSLYDIPECGSNLPNFTVRAKHNIISFKLPNEPGQPVENLYAPTRRNCTKVWQWEQGMAGRTARYASIPCPVP